MYNLNNDMWLGINNIANENEWIAADGIKITYFNWAEGEPNDNNNSEDAIDFSSSRQGFWNDRSVLDERPVGCTYRPFTTGSIY